MNISWPRSRYHSEQQNGNAPINIKRFFGVYNVYVGKSYSGQNICKNNFFVPRTLVGIVY
uniref:Uncharacterized protein n=1 Tax=Anguilla anguilla TaxID=7936 RepID=A0A0E9QWP0_ANGAN